jgi:[acyl-carrier-protein] S-malonyltransferase
VTARDAYFFPGLGAVRPAQLGKFLILDPAAAGRLATADAVLGYPVLERFAAEADEPGEATRVAFLVACLGLARWADEELGVSAGYCLGMSLGEQVALAHAGCLELSDAVRLTAGIARAELAYFATTDADLVTQMVTRVPDELFAEVLAAMAARDEWHEVSGRLDAGVYLVTLAHRHLDAFVREVGRIGGYALSTMRPPAHAARFAPLRRRIEDLAAGCSFAAPRLPVVSDADGSVITDGEAARAMLVDGFVRPLRWRDTAPALRDLGVSGLHVVGPDRIWHRLDITTALFDVTTVDQPTVLRHRRSRV